MSIIKRLAFALYVFIACGIVYYLVGLSLMMTFVWLDKDTSVLRWAAVVSMSAGIFFLLWRNSKRAYKALWKIEQRKEKEKNEYAERLETPEKNEDITLENEQSKRKSKP